MIKKLLYIAMVLLCLSVISTGTLAYFTAEDTARNVITSGGIAVEVVEQQMVNGTLQPYPNEPIPVMPATTVSKIVAVKSTEQEAWVRMYYSVTVFDANGQKMEIAPEELEKVIIIEPDSINWTRKWDWWYCIEPVESGETSKPLFEEVKFSGAHMDNKYQNCTVVVDITAQAVQHANNGAFVMEAIGWPET